MNKINWLDLYSFLYERANNSKYFGQFNWDDPVLIHNANTGLEEYCDTYIVSDTNSQRLVLATHSETVQN